MTNDFKEDELSKLEARINALLPPRYVGCFEDVSPASMGSAALRYDSQGKVVWGEIWTTFCHLALAGGPPHRGRFLEAVPKEEATSDPQQYQEVVTELKRALRLCVDLPILDETPVGWIALQCESAAIAAWLVRAIIAENVMARNEDTVLLVPAGPSFRVEKEIKNVVVAVAKTCHYMFDHLEPEQMPVGEAPKLIRPPLPQEISSQPDRHQDAAAKLQQSIQQATGMITRVGDLPGWVGCDCGDEESAVWLLRAVATHDILVRREEAVLYVPVDLSNTGANERVAKAVGMACRLSKLRHD